MPDIDLVRIGPDDWREFSDARLAALLAAPGAFGSRHDAWVAADAARWRARLPAGRVARGDDPGGLRGVLRAGPAGHAAQGGGSRHGAPAGQASGLGVARHGRLLHGFAQRRPAGGRQPASGTLPPGPIRRV